MKMLRHRFVEFIPEKVEEGVLYISINYCTAIHKCACGCGEEVVTPLSPTDWKLTFNGKTVSLDPSIGNWSFECRSHYWITNNTIEFASSWTKEEIRNGRHKNRRRKQLFFEEDSRPLIKEIQHIEKHSTPPVKEVQPKKPKARPSFWDRVLSNLRWFKSNT